MAAQAGLCLGWSETPEDIFSHVVARKHSLTRAVLESLIEDIKVCAAIVATGMLSYHLLTIKIQLKSISNFKPIQVH